MIFRVDPGICTAAELSSRLKHRGVLINAFAPTLLRAVTHLDVDRADVDRAAEALQEAVGESMSKVPLAAGASAPYA